MAGVADSEVSTPLLAFWSVAAGTGFHAPFTGTPKVMVYWVAAVVLKVATIGEGATPRVCAPLIGATEAALLEELSEVLPRMPDAIEWRADFFAALADRREVLAMANRVAAAAAGCVLIFTIRSMREGGQAIGLSAREALDLAAAIAAETDFGYVDCELASPDEDMAYLRDAAHSSATRVIASYHNFDHTPASEVIVGKFMEAERRGLDVAKVAVMPQSMEDVLTLLAATLEGKKRCGIPLITMSMGNLGSVSRLVGGVFGSALSFAVGHAASAPGQVPIDDLRAVLAIVERSRGLGATGIPSA